MIKNITCSLRIQRINIRYLSDPQFITNTGNPWLQFSGENPFHGCKSYLGLVIILSKYFLYSLSVIKVLVKVNLGVFLKFFVFANLELVGCEV